jgi:hypothetical protein
MVSRWPTEPCKAPDPRAITAKSGPSAKGVCPTAGSGRPGCLHRTIPENTFAAARSLNKQNPHRRSCREALALLGQHTRFRIP